MSELTAKFRDAFRAHPAGVALITAHVDGRPVGMTVSSLASLTLEPLSVSFSLSQLSGSAGGLAKASSFLIHLLSTEHAALADTFARKGTKRFTPEQGWDYLATGEPYLPSAPAALRARPLQVIEVGAARLIAAEVTNVLPGPAGEALLYHDRRFLGIARAETAEAAATD